MNKTLSVTARYAIITATSFAMLAVYFLASNSLYESYNNALAHNIKALTETNYANFPLEKRVVYIKQYQQEIDASKKQILHFNMILFLTCLGIIALAALVVLRPLVRSQKNTANIIQDNKEKTEVAHKNELFLREITRELRTSLNGIIGITSLIDNGSLSSEQREKMLILKRSSNSMIKLIDQIERHVNMVMGYAQEQLVEEEEVANLSEAFDSRVLVAEDNKINQLVIDKLLKKLGCSVDIANDGSEALQLYKQFEYDIVLMDCEMPEMDGYIATKKIRLHEKDRSVRHCPVVALTAHTLEEDRQSATEAGMDAVIAKPITLPILKRILNQFTPEKIAA